MPLAFGMGTGIDRVVPRETAEHYAIATWRNVLICLWVDDTPVVGVKSAQRTLAELALAYPQGVGLLQVVCEGCNKLEGDQRGAIQELLRSGREIIRDSPVVFEGDGFRAAAVRAIVATIAALSNHGFPHRVFPNVASAAESIAVVLEPREPTRYGRELAEAVASSRLMHRNKYPGHKSVRPRPSSARASVAPRRR